jgi:kumamolisin
MYSPHHRPTEKIMPSGRIPIPGSEPPFRKGTTVLGPTDPAEVATVSVVLRPPADDGDVDPRTLSLEEKRERYGAAPEDVQAVVDFAAEHALEVVDARLEARTVWLRGSLAALGGAFGVGFERRGHSTGEHRGQVGPVTVPAPLAERVLGVLGLDDRRLMVGASGAGDSGAADSGVRPIDLTSVASYFDLPEGDGTGQFIAILAFGSDLTRYQTHGWFEDNHLPVPHISSRNVDGGTQGKGPEPWLDVTMAGVLAPGARIVAYFAPFGSKGMHDAAVAAITHGASVISISYGVHEGDWTSSERASIDSAFYMAKKYGATVCVASGDSGATFVSYPAVSPGALACGGTQIGSSGTQQVWWDQYSANSWQSSGGGVSTIYPVPAFQSDNGVVPVSVITGSSGSTGRGIPDVAGLARGFVVPPHGSIMGGTSASAPFWAGVIARLNQSLGYNLGYLNPTIYGWGQTSSAFTDITEGDNIPPGSGGQGYTATAGWDACTGLGTPVGTAMLAKLQPPG